MRRDRDPRATSRTRAQTRQRKRPAVLAGAAARSYQAPAVRVGAHAGSDAVGCRAIRFAGAARCAALAAGRPMVQGRSSRTPSCRSSRGPRWPPARPAAVPPRFGRQGRPRRTIASVAAASGTGRRFRGAAHASDHGDAGPCGAARYRLTGRDTGDRPRGDHLRRTTRQTWRPQAVHSTRLGHSGQVLPRRTIPVSLTVPAPTHQKWPVVVTERCTDLTPRKLPQFVGRLC